jgi:hypothetical protein
VAVSLPHCSFDHPRPGGYLLLISKLGTAIRLKSGQEFGYLNAGSPGITDLTDQINVPTRAITLFSFN